MIDSATVEKIIDAADIVDVISDFVTLRKRGTNYVACCPFHNEKTPSFSVSPSKGIFKCFGCGKAGSAVTFVMEHEQMTYPEALKYLARKYGIEVHEREETEQDAEDRLKRESMIAVSEFAAKFYADALFNTAEGHSVGLSYFRQKREFSEETIRKFGLGWAPSGRSFAGEAAFSTLPQAALKAGYKKEFLLSTGLCYEHNGELVDRFRERVIFPIHSLSGNVIAFGGRTLKEDKTVAKYVNSPESEIYHKSNSLYAIYFAKSAIAREQKCYLVEGYADVISMHQAGIENVTASSGTSLTSEQIRLIKRFTNNVTLLYDGDSAGIKAALRGINMLLEEGMTVKVLLLPDGHDPDSFARSHTRQEILDFLQEHEVDFIEFKYGLLSSDIEKDPMRKAELIRDIIGTVAVIPDQIMRSVYIEQCAGRLGMKEDVLFAEVARIRRKKIESGEYERRRREEKEARYAAAVEDRDAGHDGDYGAVSTAGNTSSLKPVPLLDPAERELLYYLLKFGEYVMTFDDHQKYGAEAPVMDITVAEYISAQLSDDDLELHNPLYKRIYDMYFEIRSGLLEHDDGVQGDPESLQGRIIRSFVNSMEPDVTAMVLDITEEKYVLNVKEYVRAQIPERNVIGRNVPKAVLVYKLKYVEYTCSQLMETLRQTQQDADTESQQDVMHRLKLLLQIKNALVKDLNRVS
ncbi:MAG TPA: DNA primase [Candidatus Coprenecus stercoravium]|uniref:DNA primase n=1 Tax=Candidatus Coprenecus stercoravium TaxID=2840735 RepID=A0A9D2GS83_9BACT|nr:DNA primase [Candidatus Coprenecus stercoravium]